MTIRHDYFSKFGPFGIGLAVSVLLLSVIAYYQGIDTMAYIWLHVLWLVIAMDIFAFFKRELDKNDPTGDTNWRLRVISGIVVLLAIFFIAAFGPYPMTRFFPLFWTDSYFIQRSYGIVILVISLIFFVRSLGKK